MERYGQVIVTTSDGRRATSATVLGALEKLFATREWIEAFWEIPPKPDGGQIVEGQAGA